MRAGLPHPVCLWWNRRNLRTVCVPMSHARSTLKCMFRQMYLLKETDKDLSCCKFLSCSLQEGFGLRTSSLVSFSSASKYDINCLSHTGSSLFTQAPSLQVVTKERHMRWISLHMTGDQPCASVACHDATRCKSLDFWWMLMGTWLPGFCICCLNKKRYRTYINNITIWLWLTFRHGLLMAHRNRWLAIKNGDFPWLC
jgi:hypothetical protein